MDLCGADYQSTMQALPVSQAVAAVLRSILVTALFWLYCLNQVGKADMKGMQTFTWYNLSHNAAAKQYSKL